MDPNVCLARIRELLAYGPIALSADLGLLDELAEHVRAMDDWLARGGFLPDGWKRPAVSVTMADDQLRD